jgi:hypothetical protein
MRLLVVVSWMAAAEIGHAEPSTQASPVSAVGAMTIDGGVALAKPTALSVGMSTGAAAGLTFGDCAFRWGPRVAWTTTTEPGDAWIVTHSDLRLRLAGSIEHVAGRGRFGLRLGLGGTLVHESRLRQQGDRAGLTGDALETSTWAWVPAGDLDAVVSLRTWGSWLLVVSGGPSIAVVDGDPVVGWSSQIGVAWTR